MSIELERIVVRLIGDASSFNQMIDESQQRLEGMVAAVGTLTAATVVLNKVIQTSLDAYSKFDKAMVESTSIMQVTEEQTKRMRKAALDLSGTVPHSPEELAKAFYVLASAGYTAEQAIALLPAVSRFATAGATDLSYAATLAAGAQTGLGLRAADATQNMREFVKVTDVLTKANNLAEGSMQDFANALSRSAAATLKSYNKTIEEGVAILMVYHSQNLKGKTAGEHLGRLLRQLAGSSAIAGEEQKKLGFSVFDTNQKFRPLADIIENLERLMKGMSDEGKAIMLEGLGFKSLHQKAILPLIGTSAAIRAYEAQLRSAGGETEQVANKQMSAFANQMKTVQNQITAVAIGIGEELAPGMKLIGQSISIALKFWNQLPSSVRVGIIAIGLATVAMVALTAVIIAAGYALNIMFGGAPILIGLLVSGIATLAIWFGVALGSAVSYFGSIQGIIDAISATFAAIKERGMAAWAWLLPVRRAVESLYIVWITAGKAAWNELKNIAESILQVLVGDTSANLEKMGTMIMDSVRNTMNYYKAVVLETLIQIEYAILNLSKIWRVAWNEMAVNAIDAMRVLHLTTPAIEDQYVLIKRQLDKDMGALIGGFAAFRKRKLAEFNLIIPPPVVKQAADEAEKAGEEITQGMTKGALKELAHFDTALFRSMEAVRRVIQYREGLDEPGGLGVKVSHKAQGPQVIPGPPFLPNQPRLPKPGDPGFGPNVRASLDEQLELLRRIANASDKMAGQPQNVNINLDDAALT